jgi:hypothetical protein
MDTGFDVETIKNQALEQSRSGKSLLGKGDVFAPFREYLECRA